MAKGMRLPPSSCTTGLGWVAGLSLLIGAGRIMENESFTHVTAVGMRPAERSRDWQEGLWFGKKEGELKGYF